MDKMRPFLMKVGRGKKLSRPLEEAEAYQAMRLILEGSCSEFQVGAFLAAMRIKSETPDEVVGFIRAAREALPRLQPKVSGLFDFGDPYDGKTKSLNLSPLVGLIMSAAGCPVLLHGDEGIPAKQGIGAGPILRELGALELDPGGVEKCLEEIGFAYFRASRFLPRLEAIKPLRREYGLRSSLNVIEKMWNLAGAPTLAVGIYHAPYFESTGNALLKMGGGVKGFVVQGIEGFAELRISRPTKYVEVKDGALSEKFAIPADCGFSHRENWDLAEGLNPRVHAGLLGKVLEGEKGVIRDGALFNAGVKLFWAERASSIEEGIERAREALDSGKALAKLKRIRGHNT